MDGKIVWSDLARDRFYAEIDWLTARSPDAAAGFVGYDPGFGRWGHSEGLDGASCGVRLSFCVDEHPGTRPSRVVDGGAMSMPADASGGSAKTSGRGSGPQFLRAAWPS